MKLRHKGQMTRFWWRITPKGWFLGVALALFIGGPAGAYVQDAAPGWVLVISKPPPPVVPSDPRQGLVFKLRPEMAASSVMFDTSGGPESLEYIDFGAQGDAYLTFDDGPNETSPGGVMVVDDFLDRADGAFDASKDRLITGAATGLVAPKDLNVADELGVVIVADFDGAKVATFDAQAQGDAAPLFVTTDLGTTAEGNAGGEPRRPWGVAFDAPEDRLFVGGTDGTVLVFDDYLVDQGANGPDRVITPTVNGERASANVHDVTYLEGEDILIVSDVGSATTADEPGFAADGKVFVLGNASAADGPTEVRLQIAGPGTLLGNPVGVAFDGINLFVTERTKDAVLRFDDVLELRGALELAPSGAVTVAQPEAVALVNEALGAADAER